MPRKKSIWANTREAKEALRYDTHSVHAGVTAFKKRLKNQYGRREGARRARAYVEVYAPPKPLRVHLEPASEFSKPSTRDWAVLYDTMAHAFEKAGIHATG